MKWDRVNVWTSALYTLIHSLSIAKEQNFSALESLNDRIKDSETWHASGGSYNSVLASQPMGRQRVKFRRDPNQYFDKDDVLTARGQAGGTYPQSKIEKLGPIDARPGERFRRYVELGHSLRSGRRDKPLRASYQTMNLGCR
ncbi:hypothetical protein ELH01_08385 [Rhizobium ruizarguesonis]|uniref:hypothetical protein n=1 Tax=Rhizobium ruizarguesonis TaxID=2081791 RepID=UPI00102FA933|nr:hypothetical protein [Rhizobium ruizarguesonis]TBE77258.1 hypothetical protein ELH01_08385 [Rhizobium ruizarguesonis]